MAKKKTPARKTIKKKSAKKTGRNEVKINEEHKKLINKLYNIPSGYKRKIYFLFEEKPEGDEIVHAYYRINFHNLNDNKIGGSAFVDIEDAKKRLAIIDEKHPVKKGMKRRIFPTSDETWFKVFLYPEGKSRKKTTAHWIQITREDLRDEKEVLELKE